MSIGETVVFALLGMAVIAGTSLSIYSMLPRAVLDLASEHGRYIGLGTRDRVIDNTSGNTPVANVGSLQGQSA
jgi:hypothetical protein